jgi:hypothetical protein
MPRRMAIDCDLRKAYAVDTEGHADRFECNSPVGLANLVASVARGCDLVLLEVASPLDYTDNKAIAHNKRRWTIFNVAFAVALDRQVDRLLVAPSSAWTRSMPLKARHLLAHCDQPQKDLREAEAMLWFHSHHPAAWKPLAEFLSTL